MMMQLRELRSALPRMLEPLKAKQPSRAFTPESPDANLGLARLTTSLAEAMYSTFVRSYDSTIKEVARFGEVLGGQETKQAFDLAGESRKRAPKVKQWRPTEDPNWAEPPSKRIKTV